MLVSQDDIFRQDSQLEGVTVDQGMPFIGPTVTQRHQEDAEQLTVNMPHLLDRPVPAKPNPMARFAESSEHIELMLLHTFVQQQSGSGAQMIVPLSVTFCYKAKWTVARSH